MSKNFICPQPREYRGQLLVALGSILLAVGCSNVRLADSVTSEPAISLKIPYAHGDSTGELTNRLVEAVSCQPGFCVSDLGQYSLSVRILDDAEEKIGFRYDPRELKKDKKDLILSETRTKILAEVSLIDQHTNTTIAGPVYILGSIEYDHQENSINNDINDFSLGQLSDVDTAQDVVYIPLYRDLARKISLWLQNQQDLAKMRKDQA